MRGVGAEAGGRPLRADHHDGLSTFSVGSGIRGLLERRRAVRDDDAVERGLPRDRVVHGRIEREPVLRPDRRAADRAEADRHDVGDPGDLREPLEEPSASSLRLVSMYSQTSRMSRPTEEIVPPVPMTASFAASLSTSSIAGSVMVSGFLTDRQRFLKNRAGLLGRSPLRIRSRRTASPAPLFSVSSARGPGPRLGMAVRAKLIQ